MRICSPQSRSRVPLSALAVLFSLLSLLAAAGRSWSLPAVVGEEELAPTATASMASTEPSALEHGLMPPTLADPRPATRERSGSAPRLRATSGRTAHPVAGVAGPRDRDLQLLGRSRSASRASIPRIRERAERVVFLI